MTVRNIHICLFYFTFLFASACISSTRMVEWRGGSNNAYTGSSFYRQAAAYHWQQRDSLAMVWLLEGRVPSFMKKFERVDVSMMDSLSGRIIQATFFVSPDYVSLGNDDDWARIPLTPMAAQRLADSLGCFLPTRKMVDAIYNQSKVKLEPMPMFAFRDSTPTMYHHHLMVEGLRKGQRGLIAGIKKDVVVSDKLKYDGKANRVAIYGWHKPDGKPIQPLYAGHVNWYVDYSHGIRLVWQTMYVNKKPMHYSEVMKHPVYRKLLCDEQYCDVMRYE